MVSSSSTACFDINSSGLFIIGAVTSLPFGGRYADWIDAIGEKPGIYGVVIVCAVFEDCDFRFFQIEMAKKELRVARGAAACDE
jgi:hypothetical protein